MNYLVNQIKPKGKAHFWKEALEIEGIGHLQADTYCHMWSTGGLKKDGWDVVDETDKEVCSMCQNNWGKQYAE